MGHTTSDGRKILDRMIQRDPALKKAVDDELDKTIERNQNIVAGNIRREPDVSLHMGNRPIMIPRGGIRIPQEHYCLGVSTVDFRCLVVKYYC